MVIVDSIAETDNFRIRDDASFLVGSDPKWLEYVIDASWQKFSKNIIVLGNFERRLGGRTYSLVSSDIPADVRNLYAYLVSCGKTKLARFFNPSITNLKTNYKDFGKAAISVYKTLQKDFSVSSVTVNLASDIFPGESTGKLPVLSRPTMLGTASAEENDCFYADNEISEMLCVENILNHCDKTELNMLLSLIGGMTYADIAEKYHMSVNGAKYRLHKLFELCHTNSKADFIELIKKYIR